VLKAIEHATRQKIEPISLPTRDEVADRRVAQFKRQILDVIEAEKLDFFFDVVRQIEEEAEIKPREVAAALAFIAQRERPLQPEGPGWQAEAPRAEERPQREERPRRDERPTREESREAAYRRPAREEGAPLREDRPPRAERAERGDRGDMLAKRRAFSDGHLAKFRIDVGRNHGVTPKDIVGAIANEGGIEGKYIGQIHLFDEYSTVELPAGIPPEILGTLKRTRIRQTPLNIRAVGAGEVEEKPSFAKRAAPRAKPAARTGEWKPRERAGDWKSKDRAGDKKPAPKSGAGKPKKRY
jgi:ATP-dependent RNA helicase DeaD